MIAQSIEITAHIFKVNKLLESFSWMVLSCLTCDHKVGGLIPCQTKATLFIHSKTALFPPFRLQLRKNSKFVAEFIKPNKLRYASPVDRLSKINLLCKQNRSRINVE